MTSTRLLIAAGAYCLILCEPCRAEEASHREAMDFEAADAWRTAPDLLDHFDEDELWSTRTIPFDELAGGVKLSSEHVKSGKFAGKWSDHPRYPTIHTREVPNDWRGAKSLVFWAWSEEATGEKITVAIRSDNPKTLWQDYFFHTFTVDWIGWRHFVIPLDRFVPYESPAGWHAVSGVYFFTKNFNRQPNPYTVLHLDSMELSLKTGSSDTTERNDAKPREAVLDITSDIPVFDPGVLNHGYPETRGNLTSDAPIQYESYFKTERAMFGYYPRFQPGFVSFDVDGRAYLRYGSHIVQTRDSDGEWTYQDLLGEVIEPYARETLKFGAIHLSNQGQTNDAAIRFDRDGGAYMLFSIEDPTQGARSRTGLLLHSPDGMKTWDVHRLPRYMARFEKYVGHNGDCVKRPPVILMSTYLAPTTNFITVPEKQPNGTLVIPDPTKIVDGAIPMIPHSGEAGQALTHGDTVFIAFSKPEVLPGRTVEDGMPAYVVAYDVKTRELSRPTLIGFGGIDAKDDHNWVALAVDGKGTIHAIINGHHNHFVYTHSLKPWSIAAWSPAKRVAKGTSYGGLLCDKSDTLYSVTRNSHPGYYFRLSLHRKKAGQPWEEPKHLVLPFKPYYQIYYHKLVIDQVTNRLFLSYFSQGGAVSMFKDEYLAYLYTWPDREKEFLLKREGPLVPRETYRHDNKKYEYYQPQSGEMTTLVSDDSGDTWHLATSADF